MAAVEVLLASQGQSRVVEVGADDIASVAWKFGAGFQMAPLFLEAVAVAPGLGKVV